MAKKGQARLTLAGVKQQFGELKQDVTDCKWDIVKLKEAVERGCESRTSLKRESVEQSKRLAKLERRNCGHLWLEGTMTLGGGLCIVAKRACEKCGAVEKATFDMEKKCDRKNLQWFVMGQKTPESGW